MGEPANTHAEQVRTLFDVKATTWSAKYAPHGPLAGRLTRLATAVSYHVPVGGTVLELGCGTGELARHLAASGLLVAGCDISPQMLAHASAAGPGSHVSWVRLDPGWRTLPLRPASVDAVVAASVLEYVAYPQGVLQECARVLRRGGVALCTVPDPAHPVRWLEQLAIPAARSPLGYVASDRWPRLRHYVTYLQISRQRRTADWWCAAAARAGLTTIPRPAEGAERAPLRLLTFQRPRHDPDPTVEPR